MFTLIYGGSGSGKSSFAEKMVTDIGSEKRIYLATMQVYDEEGKKKVQRHQLMRKEKGFDTIEAPRDFANIKELNSGKVTDSTILLECMSNLVANEMFRDKIIISEKEVIKKVTKEVLKLKDIYENVIIVSNNIFEDGIEYDETTTAYMNALAIINNKLTQVSDNVYEIVVGIPLKIK